MGGKFIENWQLNGVKSFRNGENGCKSEEIRVASAEIGLKW